ncbi:cell surface protein [Bifidobacterium pullorum subsp. saeculare]|uniref:Cell surface protein n=1 Tax=Bifidobacterium pullorum subsp. saeculare TaxID=78257 RepID=A0A938WVM5_9BIFI|nr:cell surface protein [Bifidobacterium pullorum]MBM6699610.1 cell surface protein [Bifidobacterium pullorum subsp. saeculare]
MSSAPLYDAATGTLTIHNPYQLAMLGRADAAEQPVMSQDASAATFGMGTVVLDANGKTVTYGSAAHVVLAADFSADTPQGIAGQINGDKSSASGNDAKAEDQAAAEPQTQAATDPQGLDGRDYVGQVTKEIDGKTYILIGNEQQLRAIGTDKKVIGKLWAVQQTWSGHWQDHDDSVKLEYAGDADLKPDESLKGEIKQQGDFPRRWRLYGSGQDGQIDKTVDLDNLPTYSTTANYIIFRDIDLNGKDWTPLMFSGTMIGAKAEGTSTLWDANGTLTATAKPTISHVRVNQKGQLDVRQRSGVGFFATVTSQRNDMGQPTTPAAVKNLRMSDVQVSNTSTGIKKDESLITDLTALVSGALGEVLDFILGFLGIKLDISQLLTDLLTLQNNDPSTLATGSFAGRIVGDVTISGIEVDGAAIDHAKGNMTGGFVGYTSGVVQYDPTSKGLTDIAEIISELLNIIPGLGLGDLVTILLDHNLIKVSQLFPIGYKAPVITNSSVKLNANTVIGNESGQYAGGFAGALVATAVSGSSVTGDSVTVKAEKYAGGFAGVVRDGIVQGTLNLDKIVDLGLMSYATQSIIYDSKVNVGALTVSTAEYNAGGFAGGLAQAYMVNDTVTVTGNASIASGGDNAGGFAGVASLGWAMDLGKSDRDPSDGSGSLLGGLNNLLNDILSGPDQGNRDPLLSLAGVRETVMLGTQVQAGNLKVTSGKSNAGGLLGQGKGTLIANTLAVAPGKDDQQGDRYWNTKVPATLVARLQLQADLTPTDQNVSVTGLSSVQTTTDHAGGLVGMLQVANGGGLLDGVVGLDQLLSPTLAGATVTGVDSGATITAEGDLAGGAVGLAIGAKTQNVTVSNLGAVTASNYAGGFVGTTDTGAVVGTKGLDLLGLGVVKVNNLLSLGEATLTTIDVATVSGTASHGLKVTAKGDKTDTHAHRAGGFIALGGAAKISNAHVTNLLTVSANTEDGKAGGFVGESSTAGLADVGSKADIKELLQKDQGPVSIDGLLGAVTYLLPSYRNADVAFLDDDGTDKDGGLKGAVTADTAGGWAGELASGTVTFGDASYTSAGGTSTATRHEAVTGIDTVTGTSYAGGFAGTMHSGALADAGKGISVLGDLGLNINVTGLVSLVQAYVPSVSGAEVRSSQRGLVVSATVDTTKRTKDSHAGSAGGFLGYGAGVQISNCRIDHLRHTTVTDPKNPTGAKATSYFGKEKSSYAVTASRAAGGFAGHLDVASAASVGDGLGILGEEINLTDLLSVLNVVVSTVEHSDVTGNAAGYAVLASGTDSDNAAIGDAGGFVGLLSGGHIQDSNAYHFTHVIGQVAAGGYAGELEPGDVASVAGESGVLKKLINIDSLLSLVQSFVPTVRNSETVSVPCAGIVRAQAASTADAQRGMAGGYVGHNEGGQIWGMNTRSWKQENDQYGAYTGPQRMAQVLHLRTVYGQEIAGGFTGLMESADTASGGSLSLLGGLITAGNVLSALQAVYPTEENTRTVGSLDGLTRDEWNSWVKVSGQYGGYGAILAAKGEYTNDEAFQTMLSSIDYGYDVAAGRTEYEQKTNLSRGGNAGGYVGLMQAGTVTNAQAEKTKTVTAMQSAGGFAGRMEPGTLASIGTVGLFGGNTNLDLDGLLATPQIFVPVVKSSSVAGYRHGLRVTATGDPMASGKSVPVGYAGGFVGRGIGAQLWGDETVGSDKPTGVNATNLRSVDGLNAIGGFAGSLTSGSVAGVDTSASGSGLVQGLLDRLIDKKNYTQLLKVLEVTRTDIKNASVSAVDGETSAADAAWGFTVGSTHGSGAEAKYPRLAGGFAGELKSALIGDKNGTAGATVIGLRGVEGDAAAGGFVGNATVASVADIVSGDNTSTAATHILQGLLNLGSASVLEAFRTYVYHANVTGVADGLTVVARGKTDKTIGAAGGFAGIVKNGSIANSTVTALSRVIGESKAGGFAGDLAKGGTVDLGANVGGDGSDDGLLGLNAGVLDIWGSHVDASMVTGIAAGYTVEAQGAPRTGADTSVTNTEEATVDAGGFAGLADLSRINGSTVANLKQVTSTQVAGGFVGRTTQAYLASVGVDTNLVDPVLEVVEALAKGLLGKGGNLVHLQIPGLLELKVLHDGNVASVNLLGLLITVQLSEDKKVAHVGIGDSSFDLKIDGDGNVLKGQDDTIAINLIKANRTAIDHSSVNGIVQGYDVFGGGADQDSEGTDKYGIAGGFVGYNREGLLTNDRMLYADTIKGTPSEEQTSGKGTHGNVGPFTGRTDYDSTYAGLDIDSIESENNSYAIYRSLEPGEDAGQMMVEIDGQTPIASGVSDGGLVRFDVEHRKEIKEPQDLEDAVIKEDADEEPLNAYVDSAEMQLMLNTPTFPNSGGQTPEPGDGQDPCGAEGCANVNLTVQKVWVDDDDAKGLRPESISYNVFMRYVDAAGATRYVTAYDKSTGEPTTSVPGNPEPLDQQYELKADAAESEWTKNTWTGTVKLPVGFWDKGDRDDPQDDVFRYYTYSAEEQAVNGYESSATASENNTVFQFTNKLRGEFVGNSLHKWHYVHVADSDKNDFAKNHQSLMETLKGLENRTSYPEKDATYYGKTDLRYEFRFSMPENVDPSNAKIVLEYGGQQLPKAGSDEKLKVVPLGNGFYQTNLVIKGYPNEKKDEKNHWFNAKLDVTLKVQNAQTNEVYYTVRSGSKSVLSTIGLITTARQSHPEDQKIAADASYVEGLEAWYKEGMRDPYTAIPNGNWKDEENLAGAIPSKPAA